MRIKGFDKAFRALKDLGKYGNEDEKRKLLKEWAGKIQNSARKLCNDPDGKRIKVEVNEDGTLTAFTNDKESLDCLINAIDEQKKSMEFATRTIFEQWTTQLQLRKKEFDST
jgi:hypothetical protein